MSISGVLDRLDDWLNPIVVKELRQAVKSRLVAAILLLFLGLQLLIVSIYLGVQVSGGRTDPLDWRAGGELSWCCRRSCWAPA